MASLPKDPRSLYDDDWPERHDTLLSEAKKTEGLASRREGQSLRMECLRLALSMHGEPSSHTDIVRAAEAFEKYVKGETSNG